MTYSVKKPRIGISACLLGHQVRFNGSHCQDEWLVDELSRFVTWVPLCPEMEMGLGAPRESLRWVQAAPTSAPRLVGNKTRTDHTANAERTADALIERLRSGEALDGYILKKQSPSCGIERIKVYSSAGMPLATGVGFFAKRLSERFPGLPMIEEGRLTQAAQREHFVLRVHAHFRLRLLKESKPKAAALQKFHQDQKFLLLAHCPDRYRKLGQLAANSDRKPAAEAFQLYEALFLETLSIPSNAKKWTNVLQHLFGFLKDELDAQEKKQILEVIEDYRHGRLPLLAPLSLLQHLIKKFSLAYLESQSVFAPYPKELALRNAL